MFRASYKRLFNRLRTTRDARLQIIRQAATVKALKERCAKEEMRLQMMLLGSKGVRLA